MLSAVLAAIFIFSSPTVWAAADASAALDTFEGEWGFVSVDPQDDWASGGFANGAGACGAEKALRIDIREDVYPDGLRVLTLRLHPDAEAGVSVTTLETTGDDRARLTTVLLGQIDIFERTGDMLTMTRGTAVLTLERCE